MSQPLEQITKAKNSSHEELEYYSNSEEGSTGSEEDTFLFVWYPSPPHIIFLTRTLETLKML